MSKFKVGDFALCVTENVHGLHFGRAYAVVDISPCGELIKFEYSKRWYSKSYFSICPTEPCGSNQPQPTKFNASGSKYLREIKTTTDGKIDVYAVLIAFNVTSPARQHAIKKLLCAGIRGKNNELNDIEEARDAIERDIDLLEANNE